MITNSDQFSNTYNEHNNVDNRRNIDSWIFPYDHHESYILIVETE
jgi:hypothetical protein